MYGLVGVVSRRQVWLVGVGGIYGCGWNLWVWLESMGVVVRRYIDYLILLIPTPLVSVLFYSSIPTFCSFLKCFLFLYIYIYIRIINCSANTKSTHNLTNIEHLEIIASEVSFLESSMARIFYI